MTAELAVGKSQLNPIGIKQEKGDAAAGEDAEDSARKRLGGLIQARGARPKYTKTPKIGNKSGKSQKSSKSGSLCNEDDDCDNGCCVGRCISNTANQCVLKSLYEATNGDSWRADTGWDFEIVSDPCASGSSWFGVTCEEDDIIGIELGESSCVFLAH